VDGSGAWTQWGALGGLKAPRGSGDSEPAVVDRWPIDAIFAAGFTNSSMANVISCRRLEGWWRGRRCPLTEDDGEGLARRPQPGGLWQWNLEAA